MAELAADRQANEIVLLDLRETTVVADYFVICTGTSERQIQAIVNEATRTLSRSGVKALRTEGSADSGWLLVDFGAVIFHVFAPTEREYYRLDRLWSEATPVLRME
ncbi:MAG: ribosome silencing factor [Chloroflexi bacterium]|nr:ribosome silencing factor [Chloroflexota bacterium]